MSLGILIDSPGLGRDSGVPTIYTKKPHIAVGKLYWLAGFRLERFTSYGSFVEWMHFLYSFQYIQ